jgi:hypothetical protein
MDPPEVGPIWYPGMPGPEEVHGLVHPVIPSGRPCALLPARQGLRYYCVAIYYHSVVGSSGHGQLVCPWHLSSGHIRALVGNYSPPTPVATCNPVLVILTSVEGTIA